MSHPRLETALHSGYFRRAAVNVRIVSVPEELPAEVAAYRHDLVIVVAGVLPSAEERVLAKWLRSEIGGGMRAQLLLAVPSDRMGALQEDILPYDALVPLEEPDLELARALTRLGSFAVRKRTRWGARLPVILDPGDDQPIDGMALDVSDFGAGLLLGRRPDDLGAHGLEFYRADGRRVEAIAELAWAERRAGAYVRVGVRFFGVTEDFVRRMHDLAFWELVEEAGEPIVFLHGEIRARTEFDAVLERVADARILDLRDVTGFDREGAAKWAEFLRRLPRRICLRRVSPAALEEVTSSPALRLRCEIESCYLPFACRRCGAESVQLTRARSPAAPLPCHACGGEVCAVDEHPSVLGRTVDRR